MRIAPQVAAVLCLGPLAFGQAVIGEFHFAPSTLPHFADTGRPLSSDYLFSPAARSFVLKSHLEFKMPWNADQHTFLFGPEFHLPIGKRLTFNFGASVGMVKLFSLAEPLISPTDATPPRFGLPSGPASESKFNGANQFAVSVRGNLDYRFTDRLKYRIVQTEYLRMDVEGKTQIDRRVSTGLRLSFGK